MTRWEAEILTTLLYGLLIVWPVWRIHLRAGLNPLFALLVFVPFIGWFAALAILGLSRWPATEGPAEDKGEIT
tara:strand:- start:1929 stop:2147 length:219 start_codon:yes stop_codon:yes gene_type:complete